MQKVNEQDIKTWLEEEDLFKREAADDSAEFHYIIEYNNKILLPTPKYLVLY